jgi:hypothetical protein
MEEVKSDEDVYKYSAVALSELIIYGTVFDKQLL